MLIKLGKRAYFNRKYRLIRYSILRNVEIFLEKGAVQSEPN